MERRAVASEVWLFGHRESDLINPDVVVKIALIFAALMCVCISLLGLWSVVPN
jgi:hypothetical protein